MSTLSTPDSLLEVLRQPLSGAPTATLAYKEAAEEPRRRPSEQYKKAVGVPPLKKDKSASYCNPLILKHLQLPSKLAYLRANDHLVNFKRIS